MLAPAKAFLAVYGQAMQHERERRGGLRDTLLPTFRPHFFVAVTTPSMYVYTTVRLMRFSLRVCVFMFRFQGGGMFGSPLQWPPPPQGMSPGQSKRSVRSHQRSSHQLFVSPSPLSLRSVLYGSRGPIRKYSRIPDAKSSPSLEESASRGGQLLSLPSFVLFVRKRETRPGVMGPDSRPPLFNTAFRLGHARPMPPPILDSLRPSPPSLLCHPFALAYFPPLSRPCRLKRPCLTGWVSEEELHIPAPNPTRRERRGRGRGRRRRVLRGAFQPRRPRRGGGSVRGEGAAGVRGKGRAQRLAVPAADARAGVCCC